MIQSPTISLLAFLSSIFIMVSCNGLGIKEQYPTIPGYHLENPVTIHLKTELDEISGIVFYNKDTSVFAINDELGKLYKIYIRETIRIEEWKFSDDADYEDLALVDSTFYALHSNGSISKFKIFSEDSLQTEELNLPLSGKNEFETLYHDSASNNLVIVCKDCQDDKKQVSAYAFNLASMEFNKTPFFIINSQEVLNKLPEGEKQFKPSGAAVHPISGDLFIISSVNKSLSISGKDGTLKKVYALNPAIFKQPEGITFTPTGDLLISNEAAEIGAGNILIFKYNPQK